MKQGRWGEKRPREEEVCGKGGVQKTPPPQRMEGEVRRGLSPEPEPGPFRPRPGSSSPGLSLSAGCPPSTPHSSVLTNPHVLPALSLFIHSFSLCPYTGRVVWLKFQPLCYIYAELSRTSSSGLSWLALPSLSTHISGHVILPEMPRRAFVSHSWPPAEPPRFTWYV